MGKIVKRCEIEGDKGRKEVDVLFDSGASYSIIRKDVAEKVATILRFSKGMEFTLANGKTPMHTREITILKILAVDKKDVSDDFYVVNELSRDVIVGADMMQTWDMHLHPKRHKITVGVDPKNLELACWICKGL